MNNKLSDLNDHLFDQLRRLNDPKLSQEQLSREIERTKGVCLLANEIIQNANTSLKAMCIHKGVELPPMLAIESQDD